jgi:protein CWC15
LKLRRQGQTSEVEVAERDLRAELLRAEAEHRKKIGRTTIIEDETERSGQKRLIEGTDEEEDDTAKRRKILDQARELDAESEEDDEER